MNTIATTALTLLLATTALAEPSQVQISSRFEGFDTDVQAGLFNGQQKAGDVLAAPSVTTKSGQRAVIEIIREVRVPGDGDGAKTLNTGVSLEVNPVVKDGHITLSGTSTVRRLLPQNDPQPLGALSFATRETYFSGQVEDGKEFTLSVGDGPKDKSRIVLTVRLIHPAKAAAK